MGRGGDVGLMVSVFTLYSDDPSSNPAKANTFFCKMFEKNENKQKRGRDWPI